MSPTFERDVECRSCHGTGLYSGMAERDGAAVVCHKCHGTGCERITLTYTEFTQRRPAPLETRRVFRTNPGIVIGEGDGYRLEDFGGVPLGEWQQDPTLLTARGTEDRLHTCPAWFYQNADYKLKPDFNDAERKCSLGGAFWRCQFFEQKAGCWAKFDREAPR